MRKQLVRQLLISAGNTSSDSAKGPGGTRPPGSFLKLLILTVLFSGSAAAEPWAKFFPYVPERREYQVELGGMWENDNMYWLGMTAGQHIGRCMGSQSQTCQQYIDITGGAGNRESLTVGVLLASLRWQYVHFPKPFSPFARVMAGMVNIRDNERDRVEAAAGLGAGLTAALHERFELKIEGRVGQADAPWSQVVVALSLKIDNWVDYFEQRVRSAPETIRGWMNINSTKP